MGSSGEHRPLRHTSARPSFSGTRAGAAAPGDDIEEGKGAFKKPPPMVVGAAARLIFAVAPDEARVRSHFGNREIGETTDIFISPVMQVDLVPDANFEFTSRSTARIPLGPDRRATWHWDVIPKKRGKFILTAKVQVFRDGEPVDEYDAYVDVKVRVGRNETVKAEIGFWKMVGEEFTGLFDTWQKTLLALAALIGAGFAVIKVIKSRGAAATGRPPRARRRSG